MDFAILLQEQNDRYWRVRERVKRRQAEARESDNLRKKNTTRKVTKCLIEMGEIVKTPCQVCGETKVDTHHLDYNQPRLVMFLCKKHHIEWHKNNTPHY